MANDVNVQTIMQEIRARVRQRSGSPAAQAISEFPPSPHFPGMSNLDTLSRSLHLHQSLVGEMPPEPPTWRGRVGSLLVKGVRRILFWYTPQIRDFQAGVVQGFDQQLTVLRSVVAANQQSRDLLVVLKKGLVEVAAGVDRMHAALAEQEGRVKRILATAIAAESQARRTLADRVEAEIVAREHVQEALRAEVAEREQVAHRLGAEIATRGALLEAMGVEAREHEDLARRLDAETAARESLHSALSAELAAREELARRLEAETAARERLHLALSAQLTESTDHLARRLDAETAAREAIHPALSAELAAREELARRLEAETAARERLHLALSAQLTESTDHLARRLDAETAAREAIHPALSAELAAREELARRLEAETAARERLQLALAESTDHLARRLDTETAAREAIHPALSAELAAREELARRLEAETAARERLQLALAESTDHLARRLDTETAAREAIHPALSAQLAESTDHLARRFDAETAAREAIHPALSAELAAREELARRLEAEIATRERLDAILAAEIRAREKLDLSLADHSLRRQEMDAVSRQTDIAIHQLRAEISHQTTRISILLEEARRRLPQISHEAPLLSLSDEDRHALDALYLGLEDRFRGSQAEIKDRLRFYLPLLEKHKIGTRRMPILDLGCGRGEWLEVLGESESTAYGVDANRLFIADCKNRGLRVVEEDVLHHLRSLPDGRLGAVTGFHIIEHLSLDVLIKLIDETVRVLKPGGLAIFETPNPQNVLVGSHNFYIDPTHRNPIPCLTAQFLLEARGLCDVEILQLHPYAESYKVPDSGSELARRFNDYFYGPQDYAVIGRKV